MASIADRINKLSAAQRALLKQTLFGEEDRGRAREPIAVVGIGCRFPGGGDDPDSYFARLCEGLDAVTEVPAGRWDVASWYAEDPSAPGKTRSRWGAFLSNVTDFDHRFFGISRPEADRMDPRHRIALEVALEALDDAGLDWASLRGSRTGVFMGSMADEYTWRQVAAPDSIDVYTASGASQAALSNRISFELDLRGPSLTIDTACSSSMVAIHQACASLLGGESDLAVAGGVNVMVTPVSDVIYTKLGALSPTGRCRTFDRHADGIVRGEGAGAVVLKRLSDAQRDGDRVWAVIRGSAVAQDGRTSTMTAPNGLAQADMIRRALAAAGVSGREIGFVEAHGTGTPIGDPIEVEALRSVLADGRRPDQRLVLGAVKANLGHQEAAAGVAAFIKTVLCVARGRIPPVVHFTEANRHIDLDAGLCVVPTEAVAWPAGYPRRLAGVSSFGLTGTLAHVIVEEAPAGAARERASIDGPQLLVLSARSEEGLRARAAQIAAHLETGAVGADLADVAFTAARRRTHHRQRLAVVAASAADAATRLRAYADQPERRHSLLATGSASADPMVAWVFPGSGTFRPGMGRSLHETEPVYRDAVLACDRLARAACGVSPVESLLDASDRADQGVLRNSLVVLATQVGLAALWRSWGIEPAVVLGQSLGEVAAAHVAGALSLEDSVRVVVERSRCLERVDGDGATAVVELGFDEAAACAAPFGASCAGELGPTTTAVSGPRAAVERLVAEMQGRGVFARVVPGMGFASHGPEVAPLGAALARALDGLAPAAPRIPFLSGFTGAGPAGALDAEYWAANLTRPFRFATGVRALAERGASHVVELSGHPALLRAVESSAAPRAIAPVPSLRRGEDDRAALLSSLGALHAGGVAVRWNAVVPDGALVSLPPLPWQRVRAWIEGPAAPVAVAPAAATATPVTAAPSVPVSPVEPAPGDMGEIERGVAVSWAEVLDVPVAGIRADSNFFDLGGQSLKAFALVRRISERFGVRVAADALAELVTVQQVADHIRALSGEAPADQRGAAPSNGSGAHGPGAASSNGHGSNGHGPSNGHGGNGHARGGNGHAEAPRAPAERPASAAPAPETRRDPAPIEAAADPARYEPFPLTDIQQAYWIGRTDALPLGRIGTHYFGEFDTHELDLARIEEGWNLLVARHDMLRAVIRPDGTQAVLPEVPRYQIPVHDLRGAPARERDAVLERAREEMSHRVYAPARWPLFGLAAYRLSDSATRFLISLDFLVCDGHSIAILSDELQRLYHDPAAPLPRIPLSFRQFVLERQRERTGAAHAAAERYWDARLDELPAPPALPVLNDRIDSIGKPRFVRRSGRLDAASWSALRARARSAGLSASSVVQAAYAEVLALYSEQPVFSLNITTFNERAQHPDAGAVVGDFTSSVPLAVDLRGEGTFEDRARALQKQLWKDLSNADVTAVAIARKLATRRPELFRLGFPVVYTGMVTEDGQEPLPMQWLGRRLFAVSQTPQVLLDLQVMQDRGDLVFELDAVDELFRPGVVDGIFAALDALLRDLAQEPPVWRAASAARLPDQQVATRRRVNATDAPVPHEPLHAAFVRQAAAHPERPAVIDADATLSYGDLDRISAAIASRLLDLGVRPEQRVAIDMDKGWEQVAAAMGAARAGAAFLPLDPGLPDERRQLILERAEAVVRLTQPRLAERGGCAGATTLVVTADLEAGSASLPEVDPDRLAYVIFTSGSTGAPKGVMITHRAALNTLVDVNQRFRVGPGDRVLALSALSFDLSIYDVFGLLAAGGAIVIPAPQDRLDPARWAELVERHGVTLWNSVPTLVRLYVERLEARGERMPAGLRTILMSGDWIPLDLPGRIRALSRSAEVISLGGATEASVWSIVYPVDDVSPGWASIPYGTPLANQRFHVLNDRLADVPDQVVGELFIGGAGVASGYLREPELTAERFFGHPRTMEAMYRTGDLGRYLPDGNIEFLGRKDLQTKIQGYRVELEEIEAVVVRSAGVAAAAVIAVGPRDGNRRLVAHVVRAPGAALDLAELQRQVGERLPSYMVPSEVVFRDALPLSATGKVDRKALEADRSVAADPAPAAAPAVPAPADTAPAAAAPAVDPAPILGLIRDALRLGAAIDEGRTLVQLGATSIDIMTLANALEARFDTRPDMPSLFNRLSVRQVLAFYGAGSASSPATVAAAPAVVAAPASSPAVIAAQASSPTASSPSVPAVPLLVDAEERRRFAASRPARRAFPASRARTAVTGASTAGFEIATRTPLSADPVDAARLLDVIAALGEQGDGAEPGFGYSSASNLYPVQVYLHVTESRVSGLTPGGYYLDAAAGELVRLSDAPSLPFASLVQGAFRADAERAAFSIYLVLDGDAVAPMYGPRGRDLALLEAGAMGHRLELAGVAAGVALTNIGSDMDFAALRALFELGPHHQLLFALVGGSAAPARAGLAAPAPLVPAVVDRSAPFPLLEMQEAIWVGRTGDYQLGDVSVHMYLEFETDKVDPARMSEAWRQLIATHDMLAAVVRSDGKHVLLDEVPHYEVQVIDIADLPAAQQEARITAAREEMSHQVMAADRWPLFDNRVFRLGGARTRVLCSVDELLIDATSSNILLRDLHRAYHGQPLHRPGIGFRDYVAWEASQRSGARYDAARRYWMSRMDTLPPAPQLPLARQPRELDQVRFKRYEVMLPQADWAQLRANAREAGVTPAVALCTAFACALRAWSKSAHFTLNLTLFDRAPIHPDIVDVIGQFTRNLLLEVDQRAPATFAEHARRIQDQLWQDLEHREFSGIAFQRELARARTTGDAALMPVVFTSMLDLPGLSETGGWPDWLGDPVETITQTPQIWMEHGVLAQDDGPLRLYWDAVEGLFPDGMLDETFAAYRGLIELLVAAPGAWGERPPVLLPQAQSDLFAQVAGERAPLPSEPVHAAFLAQAERSPDAPAILCAEDSLTYGQLRRRALALAGVVAARRTGRGAPVAVIADKGLDQPVAVLGALLAGSPYVPIDSSIPAARMQKLLAAARPGLVLSTRAVLERSGLETDLPTIAVDELDLDGADPAAPVHPASPDDPAVVIFTSGSTGEPKGVVLTHRGVAHAAQYTNRRFQVGPSDRAFGITGLHHDMSLYDLFGLLGAGGAVVYPDGPRLREPEHWLELMAEHRVTIWNSVPATLTMLLDEAEARGAAIPDSLRVAFVGGDWIPTTMPGALRRHVSGLRFVSVGGPTETTVWNIMHEVDEVDPARSSIPYGKAIANARYHVLDDETLEERPVWVPGVLYCSGPCIASGYLHDPERTRKAFVRDPRTALRMYRTGDVGRYLPDGTIEFLGRADDQVKINGHRIEPGDVAAALASHPAVREAVVVARRDGAGPPRLIGYAVLQPGAEATVDDIRAHAREHLPTYMLPGALVLLDAFPLTGNGKVDRRALPDPEPSRRASDAAAAAPPDNQTEERVAQILRELLGLEKIGRHENLFDLGATSVHLVQARRRLSDELGRDVPVVDILQHPSLAQLAQLFAGPAEKGADGEARPAAAPAWKRGIERARRRRESQRSEETRG